MQRKARGIPAILLCASLAGATLLTPTIARAQDDSMIEMARERFQEGVKAYDAKQYEKARAAFLQAYAFKRHPAVLLNLAQSELRSGHQADAAKHFTLYLRENREATPLERQEAEKGLASAKTKVSELELNVDAEGADVFVDNQPEGVSPVGDPVYLEPGTHTIEARKDGKVIRKRITAEAGETVRANLTFAAGAAATDAATGEAASGGADSNSGQSNLENQPDTSDAGERQPFFSWLRDTPLAMVTAGIGIAGTGGAIAFSLVSRQNYNDANAIADEIRRFAATDDSLQGRAPCENPNARYSHACSLYNDNVDAADLQKTLAIVSGALGAAGLVTTGIYYLVDGNKSDEVARTPRPRARTAIVPVMTPTVHGLQIVGRF